MNVQTFAHKAPSIKHQKRSRRLRLRRGGWLCLSGADTGGAYCLLEASLAPGESVPRHVHTREDETYYVLSGELEVAVGGEVFVLRAGDCLMAPRDIPHQLRNPANVENHYLLMFSPPGFDEFLRVTAVPMLKMRWTQPSLSQLRFAMSVKSPPTTEYFLADCHRPAATTR
jgi:mannose-6-phosphate isomerase-like protein (cupin superfamily)